MWIREARYVDSRFISVKYALARFTETLQGEDDNMLIKRLAKTKKAISPILATLLLIVIAVAAIVVTYAWIMTYMSGAMNEATIVRAEQINFYNRSDAKMIDIFIGNSGSTDTRIVQIFVGTSKSNMPSQTTVPALPMILPAESTGMVTIIYNWTAGTTYYFKIVPQPGQPSEVQQQAL